MSKKTIPPLRGTPPKEGNKHLQDLKLATVWRVLSWSHNRLIMTLKNSEARAFYLNLSINEKLSVRELERQIDSAQFERSAQPVKRSAALRELQPAAGSAFKDTYILEYALSRNLLPTLVAQYQLQLLDKKYFKPSYMS